MVIKEREAFLLLLWPIIITITAAFGDTFDYVSKQFQNYHKVEENDCTDCATKLLSRYKYKTHRNL